MSDQELRQLQFYWENYIPIKVIVRLFPYKQVHIKKIINELRQNGVLKPRKEHRREYVQQKILSLYNSGIRNPTLIAKELNLKYSTIKNHLTNLKLKRQRPEHNYNKRKKVDINTLCDKTKEIVKQLKNGVEAKDIVKTQNVSRQYVAQIKNKYLEDNLWKT